MTQSRLVDPVHFFNSDGSSVLMVKHLTQRVEQLETENARLTKLLRAQIERNKLNNPAAETPKRHS